MNIFILIGRSSSGKDTIFKEILNSKKFCKLNNLIKVTPSTTRPIRTNEIDKIDYNFYNQQEFENFLKNNNIIEYRHYYTTKGKWTYFTSKDSFQNPYKNYIMIGTLETLKNLHLFFKNTNTKIFPIYIYVQENILYKRAKFREHNQLNPDFIEMNRRFMADKLDFSDENLKAANISNINTFNNSYSIKQTTKKIKKYITKKGATKI